MSNFTIPSAASFASFVCYAGAATLAFRNLGRAATCKIGSIVVSRLGKNAEEWNKSSAEYWTLAKKNSVRNLTTIAGLLLLGMTLDDSQHYELKEKMERLEEKKPGESKIIEENKIDNEPLIVHNENQSTHTNVEEPSTDFYESFYNYLLIYCFVYPFIAFPAAHYFVVKHNQQVLKASG